MAVLFPRLFAAIIIYVTLTHRLTTYTQKKLGRSLVRYRAYLVHKIWRVLRGAQKKGSVANVESSRGSSPHWRRQKASQSSTALAGDIIPVRYSL